MALSNILQKLYRNSGYGPELKPNIIPFTDDLASKANDIAASTEWVKDLAVSNVYVDSVNGLDSNDGLSSETPVRKISDAFAILNAKPITKNARTASAIYIAAGTYTDNIDVINTNVKIFLSGTVNLTGYINVQFGGSLEINNIPSNPVSTLNLTGIIRTCDGSFLNTSCYLNVTADGNSLPSATFTISNAVEITTGASCTFHNSVTVASSNLSHAVSVHRNAGAIFDEDLDCIIKSSQSDALFIAYGSYCTVYGTYTASSTGNGTAKTLSVLIGSAFEANAVVSTLSPRQDLNEAIYIDIGGFARIRGLTFTGTGNANCRFIMLSGSSNLTLSGRYEVKGSWQLILACLYNGVFVINPGTTCVSGGSGIKYRAATGGRIYLSNINVSNLPGTTGTGTVEAETFATLT